MIKVNGIVIEQNHFPDGSLLLKTDNMDKYYDPMRFEWHYENDSELFTIICLAKKYKERKVLYMPYCPHSRQDRVKRPEDTFTLKYFTEVINSLGFESVTILDPHSNVCTALIDRVIIKEPKEKIDNVIEAIENFEDIVLYFPDYGAYKKYTDIFSLPYCYGKKVRDWETGKILGLEIENEMNIDLKGKTIFMIDDIISYGGSMFFGSKKLKELGVGDIYAYASHTENSILDKDKGTLIKALEDGTVKRLFTTNSIFTGQHEKITVMEV